VSATFELLAAVVLAAAAIVFVLRPIFSPPAVGPVEEDAGADPDDDLSPRAVALRALKEIEFDRATGKLADADYDALKHRYTEDALQALRAGEPALPPTAVSRSVAAAARSCPTHGARPERDAVFCSECGRQLEAAHGFCSRCGSAMEFEAQFCSSCGRRVAA
jgi:hypothetical protein